MTVNTETFFVLVGTLRSNDKDVILAHSENEVELLLLGIEAAETLTKAFFMVRIERAGGFLMRENKMPDSVRPN